MREVEFGDVVYLKPSKMVPGSRGAYNKGVPAVVISSADEVRYMKVVFIARILPYGSPCNTVIKVKAPIGPFTKCAYVHLDSVIPALKYRIGEPMGSVGEDASRQIQDGLAALFGLGGGED